MSDQVLPTQDSEHEIPQNVPQKAKNGHKRTASDTSVYLNENLYQTQDSPEKLSKVSEESKSKSISPEVAAIRQEMPIRIYPKYPRPESKDQSWFDYLSKGNFDIHETDADREFAHISIAETLIHSICSNLKLRNVPVKFVLPEDSKVKEKSGAHMVLQLLSNYLGKI